MTQSKTTQPIGRIEFTNHLMFNAVLTENVDLCTRLVSAVLGVEVQNVEYLDDESTVQPTIDARGARLDLLALVDGEYVDIEMQVGAEPDIARRSRFYHGAIATRYTPKGTSYKSVPRSYVIFICVHDPLGAGRPRYELATTCLSDPTIPIDDGATTIIYNAQAWQQETDSEVAGMLHYVLTGSPQGGLADDIARAVDSKNLDRKWVKASMGIMTYEHELTVLNNELERRKAQVEEARAEAEAVQAQFEAAQAEAEAVQAQFEAAQAEAAQLKELSKRLLAEGRVEEFLAALDDAELRGALLREFGLAE